MRVLVSVPNTGWIHKKVALTLLKLQADSLGHQINMILPVNRPYENNLHHITNDFVGSGYDYWLSIDSDNPPTNNPLDLIDLDLDVVGLPTPVWHYEGKKKERPMYLNAYDYLADEDAYKEHQPQSGLQEVDAIGTGCFIVSRRVMINSLMRKAPFQRQYYTDGTVNKGNDISFCERAKRAGYKIWAHYDYLCEHFKELELTEVRAASVNEFIT